MVRPSELLVVLPRPPTTAGGLGGGAGAASTPSSDPADAAAALSALERQAVLARWRSTVSVSAAVAPLAGDAKTADEALGRALEEVR